MRQLDKKIINRLFADFVRSWGSVIILIRVYKMFIPQSQNLQMWKQFNVQLMMS